eukprot:1160679-Pelagomonas_calceolata.AAC.4
MEVTCVICQGPACCAVRLVDPVSSKPVEHEVVSKGKLPGYAGVWRHSGEDAVHETIKQQKTKGKVLAWNHQRAQGGPSLQERCSGSA